MLALKDVRGVGPNLGDTELSRSPLWDAPIERIVPVQLLAYRKRMELQGQGEQARKDIAKVVSLVAKATEGLRTQIPMLSYVEPSIGVITAKSLRVGLEEMDRPKPAAILFALEAQMPLEDVVVLTWSQVALMGPKLTPYARRILLSQPRHIRSGYVFWTDNGGMPAPLFGLPHEVFDIFGMAWYELRELAANLVLVDEDAELEEVEKTLAALMPQK